jgi:hypothetical protein
MPWRQRRSPIELPKTVDNRAFDQALGITVKLDVFRRIVVFGCIQQAYHASLKEIVQIRPNRQLAVDAHGERLHQIEMLQHDFIAPGTGFVNGYRTWNVHPGRHVLPDPPTQTVLVGAPDRGERSVPAHGECTSKTNPFQDGSQTAPGAVQPVSPPLVMERFRRFCAIPPAPGDNHAGLPEGNAQVTGCLNFESELSRN